MAHKATHFVINEQDFDLSLLPKAARNPGTQTFRKHVVKYFRKEYARVPGEVNVEFNDGNIEVTWIPSDADIDPEKAIVDLLNAGQYAQAISMLEGLLQANPNDHMALYNLGMVFSDHGRLVEARDLLTRATEHSPNHANSWTALGIAVARANDIDSAKAALERSIALEPNNPYALRTLGSLHAMKGDNLQAIESLRTAKQFAPNDPITLLTLAQVLLKEDAHGHVDEADALLKNLLKLAPQGEVAAKAAELSTKIANRFFRAKAIGELRPDAMLYCLAALERFHGMPKQQLAPVVMEMANLGQSGLNVNRPDKTYHLSLTPGDFSGLEIVCMMHVGMKMLDINMGSGMDLDKEYQAALEQFQEKQN